MKNTSIRLHGFSDDGDCISFTADIPLASGGKEEMPLDYDFVERSLSSSWRPLPRRWMAAILKAVARPIFDELYRGADHGFIDPENVIMVAIPS